MTQVAIQDCYPAEFSHCYGCGPSNPVGHHLKTYLEGEETYAKFTPRPEHSGGMPGHVYGGMIASLFDCHGTGSAAAFLYKHENREVGSPPAVRCVTASLKVDFKRPTPIRELTVTGKLRSIEGRKVWVDMELLVDGEVCATAEMLAIRI